MAYKVFLSHSARDKNLVMALARLLEKFGIEFFVAEWYLSPGERLDKKVFDAIRDCDCMVVLLTPDGVRSNWVHQEIGTALQASKPVIPIVEKGPLLRIWRRSAAVSTSSTIRASRSRR